MTMAGMLAQRASYAQTRILILVVTPAGSVESTQRKATTRLTSLARLDTTWRAERQRSAWWWSRL